MIKVLIVDDQKTVQEVIKSYLEEEKSLEVIGCANNGQQALEIVKNLKPEIVLMDIEMPVLDGLTATKIITEQFVESTVLILSVHDEDAYLNTALQVGAKGYLMKNTPSKELINAIYSAYKGYFQLGPGLLEKYLYKITRSQSNFEEIEQLKTIMVKQSQLLESIKNQPERESVNHERNIKNKYIALEQKIYSLNYRLEKANNKLSFIQQFCYFLAMSFLILILVVGLIAI